MKKAIPIFIFALLILSNVFFIQKSRLYKDTLDTQVFKVYSFEGENQNIRISNGAIILSPHKQILHAGDITYIGEKVDDIVSYSQDLYLGEAISQNIVLSFSSSTNKSISFPEEFSTNKDMGEMSSSTLFNEEELKLIKEELYFTLKYTTSSGEKNTILLKLNVNEFDLEKKEKPHHRY